jgi:hypothetical protein
LLRQKEPQGGIYCIYHSRQPGDLHYNAQNEGSLLDVTGIADCPDYAATLQRHAQQLVAAGVDFVVFDATNIPDYNNAGDALQLRPFEVLLQEWSALRASGIQTPDVAVWQLLPATPFANTAPRTVLYPYMLDLYNVPAYDRMIMRDPTTGLKTFFYPVNTQPDPGYVTDVAANSGAAAILPVAMWADAQTDGTWDFISVCEGLQYLSDAPCDQSHATGASQISAASSYQITYASLPFRSTGFFRGQTLVQQFETVFAASPQFVFLASWNEFVTNPVAPTADPGLSMGLENDASAQNVAFVDLYGEEFSRDLEPTSLYGSAALDMLTSCLRVFRSGATTCSDATEACCTAGAFSTSFAYYDAGDAGAFGYYVEDFADPASYTMLYQCLGSTGMSADGTCASGTPSVLGYTAAVKGGEMLRALRLCNDNTVSLLGSCTSGTQTILGYVR